MTQMTQIFIFLIHKSGQSVVNNFFAQKARSFLGSYCPGQYYNACAGNRKSVYYVVARVRPKLLAEARVGLKPPRSDRCKQAA
jgi:hypothetical protein